MKNDSPSKPDQAKLSVRDVASVIFSHKLLICATFLAVALGSGVMALLTPNEYESRMKILVKNYLEGFRKTGATTIDTDLCVRFYFRITD